MGFLSAIFQDPGQDDLNEWLNNMIREIRETFDNEVQYRELTEWKNHPKVAYLDRLKWELKNLPEKTIKDIEDVKKDVNRNSSFLVGMVAGDEVRRNESARRQEFEEMLAEYLQRIDRAAAGDLESEAIFLEGRIEQLKIERAKFEEMARTVHEDWKPAYTRMVAQIKTQIANYERDIREVKSTKMPQFYRDFNVSRETARASEEELNSLKNKKQIYEDLNPKKEPEPPPRPSKREELKAREAELYENLSMIKDRRVKLIEMETKGKSFDECSPDTQAKIKQIENMMDAQEQRVSEELQRVWEKL